MLVRLPHSAKRQVCHFRQHLPALVCTTYRKEVHDFGHSERLVRAGSKLATICLSAAAVLALGDAQDNK